MNHEPMPLELEKPEFKYKLQSWFPLELNIQVGEDGHKTEAQSLIHIKTDNGGYPMTLAVQTGSYLDRKWQVVGDIYDIGILVEGSYERQALIQGLQRVGLMTIPFYGKMDSNPQEDSNAIQEQSKP
jgi:hypothetical protein